MGPQGWRPPATMPRGLTALSTWKGGWPGNSGMPSKRVAASEIILPCLIIEAALTTCSAGMSLMGPTSPGLGMALLLVLVLGYWACAARASRRERHTCSGVSGSSRMTTPVASATAEPTADWTESRPPSLTPLAP